MIAMPDEELHRSRLVALGRTIAAKPSLFEMRCRDDQLVADEAAGRKSFVCMRSPRRRMRTSVHPDGAAAFRCLRPHVNGDQALVVRIALFPDSKISDSAHLVRKNVSITLMIAEREARRI